MKTLQRHRQVRPPSGLILDEATREMGPAVRTRERRIWQGRLRFVFWFTLLPTIGISLFYWATHIHLVADGLVMSNVVVLRAPVSVRVAEVYCREGDTVRKGDPLIKLEARRPDGARAVLESLVQQRSLRLELLEHGGIVAETDVGRRADRLEEARHEQVRTFGDYRIALAELNNLVKARESRQLQMQREDAEREGELETLGERVREARETSHGARADEELAQIQLDAQKRLRREGLVSRNDVAASENEYRTARRSWQAKDAAVETLRKEVDSKSRLDDLSRRLDSYTLVELDSRIDAQRERVKALGERADLWSTIVERRETLSPEHGAESLRRLEISLVRAELEEARAQLAAFDEASGNQVIFAESDGQVDRVFVRAGSVVEVGETLIAYDDPTSQWFVAYLDPSDRGRVSVGDRCRVVGEASSLETAGEVTAIARAWTPCPDALRKDDDYDMRVAVRIECPDEKARARFGPHARIRVKFSERDSSKTP